MLNAHGFEQVVQMCVELLLFLRIKAYHVIMRIFSSGFDRVRVRLHFFMFMCTRYSGVYGMFSLFDISWDINSSSLVQIMFTVRRVFLNFFDVPYR